MTRSNLRFLTVVLFLLASGALTAADSTLINFKIKDQFKNKHTHEEFVGKILVILGSDKDGSEYNAPWAKAIYDSLSPEIDSGLIRVIGYADTRGVPFFLKGWVRGKFPQEKDKWTLVDWDGILAEAYEFKEEKCNLLVFDADGILRLHLVATEVQTEELNDILKLLFSMLLSEPEPSSR